MRRLLLVVLAVLLVAGVATYLAGEQGEVAVLRTFDADGTAHDTKLWVVDLDGIPFVRVARPSRTWFQRLVAQPRVELVRNGVALPCRAEPMRDAKTVAEVDAAFAAKYGWVDAWYGLIMRTDPVPVRLEAVER